MSKKYFSLRAAVLAFLFVLPVFSLFSFRPQSVGCAEPAGSVFHREQFLNLSSWKPVFFPKIKRHTTYAPVTADGSPALEAKSDDSASALRLAVEYEVAKFPKLSWRWKVSRVYDKGDATKKSGDDYPIRVYVMFKYDPSKASAWQKLKYGAAKTIYGEYPPASALLYIWANKPHSGRILTSPYVDNVKMVVLEAGNAKAGQWVAEKVDVLADYRAAFGADPPSAASLAIMNDSDNTHESSVSWVRDLVIYK